MKTTVFPALAGLSLAVSPIAATAQDNGGVSYKDALRCSALFSLIANGSQGSDTAEFQDLATRWLVVAMNRDGTEDGSQAELDFERTFDELVEGLNELGEEEETVGEEFLLKGIDFCEAKHELIADEIDAIETE